MNILVKFRILESDSTMLICSSLSLVCRGGQSVLKDIHPDPRLHYFFRPEGERNVGYGYPKFIALPKLQMGESDFVENDAIFFRCVVLGPNN